MTPEDIGHTIVLKYDLRRSPGHGEGLQGQADCRPDVARLQGLRKQHWEPLKIFTVDPAPLSIAFVIDQSLTSDVMAKVNDSLSAFQGALSPYDEVAVFTYNNGPREWTGFTGAQGNRVPAVLALAKSVGRDDLVPVNTVRLAGCTITQERRLRRPELQPGWLGWQQLVHNTFQRKSTPSTTRSLPPPRNFLRGPRSAAA